MEWGGERDIISRRKLQLNKHFEHKLLKSEFKLFSYITSRFTEVI
jgi:hypothetical protein